VAELFCRCFLCAAPFACRVGGMDCGAQGCVERFFLDADHVELCAVCSTVRRRQVFFGRAVFCPRADEQADACDFALCPAFIGFLAPLPLWISRVGSRKYFTIVGVCPATGMGKDASFCSCGHIRRGDFLCPKAWRSCDFFRRNFTQSPNCQCPGRICAIYRQDDLSRQAGCFVSTSDNPAMVEACGGCSAICVHIFFGDEDY